MTAVVPPLNHAVLESLAPLELHSRRAERYRGDNIGVTLSDFREPDALVIARLYATLSTFYDAFQQMWESDEATIIAQTKALIEQTGWLEQIHAVQAIAGRDAYTDPRIGKVLHDVRGGGLAALAVLLHLLVHNYMLPNDSLRMFFLVRDHLKIMRNGIHDIDPVRSERDRELRAHGLDLLLEKWDHVVHQVADHSAEVVVDCRYRGVISESCLEFSALDRVLYNLLNNAARHVSDGRIYFVIFGLQPEHPSDLRFVIYNRMTPEQRETLLDNFPQGLGALFQGGFTTGGTGLGMQICAEIVSNAYGFGFADETVAGGYIGARCIEDYFVSWFHWPVCAD